MSDGHIVMDIAPMPTPRPRFARIGKGVRTYNPGKYTEYMALIGRLYKRAGGEHHGSNPVSVKLRFEVPRPLSHHVANNRDRPLKEDAPFYPTVKRDDMDNLVKGVLDGLTGHAYDDDCQVVSLASVKRYADKGGPLNGNGSERILVEIKSLSRWKLMGQRVKRVFGIGTDTWEEL